MTDEHDLFCELRNARRARSEAMLALKAARTVLRQCERTIEDIMSEIDTGKALVNGRDRPLLDAINAMQPAPAPAPAPAPPSIEKFEWTSTDLEFVLNAACYIDGRDPEGVWFSIKQTGCDDRKILEILRAIWPMTAQFRPAPPPGLHNSGRHDSLVLDRGDQTPAENSHPRGSGAGRSHPPRAGNSPRASVARPRDLRRVEWETQEDDETISQGNLPMSVLAPPEAPINALLLNCRTACECGCKRPARVEITFAGNRFMITDPTKVDMLIDELVKGRTALLGTLAGPEVFYRCREADRRLAGVALADPRPTPESRGAHPLPRRRNYRGLPGRTPCGQGSGQGASGNPG